MYIEVPKNIRHKNVFESSNKFFFDDAEKVYASVIFLMRRHAFSALFLRVSFIIKSSFPYECESTKTSDRRWES